MPHKGRNSRPFCGSGMRNTYCGKNLSSGGPLPVPPALRSCLIIEDMPCGERFFCQTICFSKAILCVLRGKTPQNGRKRIVARACQQLSIKTLLHTCSYSACWIYYIPIPVKKQEKRDRSTKIVLLHKQKHYVTSKNQQRPSAICTLPR